MVDNTKETCDVKNIILIGFMAAGKSSVGRLLARELNWDFIDTDKEIEQVTGLKIAQIFRRYGEKRLRSEENLVVKRISEVSKTVVATGGGTILDCENRKRLQHMGVLIHLFVPVEVVLQRVKKRHDRPLLKKSIPEIKQIWQNRLDIYNQGSIVIDTSDKNLNEIVSEILGLLKGGCGNNAAEN